jgi:hypothetical protein
LRSTDYWDCPDFAAGFVRGLTEQLVRLTEMGERRLAAYLADAQAGVLESIGANTVKVVIEPSPIAPLKLKERLPAQAAPEESHQ